MSYFSHALCDVAWVKYVVVDVFPQFLLLRIFNEMIMWYKIGAIDIDSMLHNQRHNQLYMVGAVNILNCINILILYSNDDYTNIYLVNFKLTYGRIIYTYWFIPKYVRTKLVSLFILREVDLLDVGYLLFSQ